VIVFSTLIVIFGELIMAVFNANVAYTQPFIELDLYWASWPTAPGSTQCSETQGNITNTYTGSGFGFASQYVGGPLDLVSGTLSGISSANAGTTEFSITGLNHSIATFRSVYEAWSKGGYTTPAHDAMASFLYSGYDTFNGSAFGDTFYGYAGNDIIYGKAGSDFLYGGAGNDFIDGGVGTDYMIGGTGNDTFVVDNTAEYVQENANEGTDTVMTTVTYSLAYSANVENITLTGSGNINATGNGLNNVLVGNAGNNVLNGGGGVDMVSFSTATGGLSLSVGMGKISGAGIGTDTLSVSKVEAGETLPTILPVMLRPIF
jgi:Ca2+-binding RTX toxin-like protein